MGTARWWKWASRSSLTPQSAPPMYFPVNQTGSSTLQAWGSGERWGSELERDRNNVVTALSPILPPPSLPPITGVLSLPLSLPLPSSFSFSLPPSLPPFLLLPSSFPLSLPPSLPFFLFLRQVLLPSPDLELLEICLPPPLRC